MLVVVSLFLCFTEVGGFVRWVYSINSVKLLLKISTSVRMSWAGTGTMEDFVVP